MLTKSLFPALAMVSATLASAQERVLTADKASGYSAVLTQCVTLTRENWANEMCDDLMERIAPMIRAEGLEHQHLGRTEWGFGTDEYLPAPQGTAPQKTVHLTAYIRATDAPAATHVWLSLYENVTVPHPARLVLWEDSGIGAGDTGTISNGLSRGLAQKLAPIFQTLGDNKTN